MCSPQTDTIEAKGSSLPMSAIITSTLLIHLCILTDLHPPTSSHHSLLGMVLATLFTPISASHQTSLTPSAQHMSTWVLLIPPRPHASNNNHSSRKLLTKIHIKYKINNKYKKELATEKDKSRSSFNIRIQLQPITMSVHISNNLLRVHRLRIDFQDFLIDCMRKTKQKPQCQPKK